MPHTRLTTGIRDRIGDYALGLLNSRQARAFEKHLHEGCAVCETELRAVIETISCLALSVPEVAPRPQLRDRVLDQVKSVSDLVNNPQVWKAWKNSEVEGPQVVRAGQGEWESVGLKGVTAKRLYVDPLRDSATMLVRMEPGATYPAHRHGGHEQCFVVEGDLTQDVALHAGDYVCAEGNTIHPVSRTEHGCLLLIISSTRDELIP